MKLFLQFILFLIFPFFLISLENIQVGNINSEYQEAEYYSDNSDYDNYESILIAQAASVPEVSTGTITNIGNSTANTGGEVIDENYSPVIARGVVWSNLPNPALNTNELGRTINGSGLGSFNSEISNLAYNTTYYYCAYATNGVGTAYGTSYSFTTLPTPYSITGDNSYCIGGTGVEIGLSDSDLGIEYQLKLDGENVGTSFIGTGNPFSFDGLFNTLGIYTIVGTNTTTLLSKQMNGEIDLTVNPLPTANIYGSITICRYQIAYLVSQLTGTPPWSLTYSDGVTINNIFTNFNVRPVNPLETTEYTITNVTDGNGCSNIGTSSATVTVRPEATADLSGSATICPGESASLQIELTGIAPFTIEFSDGFSIYYTSGYSYTRLVSPNITTNYTISVTDGCNLPALVTGNALITVNNPPTANISGTASICSGNTTDLNIVLTGTPPFSITYSDGVTENNVISPHIRTVSPDVTTNYTITNVTDNIGCSNIGDGSALVTVNSLPTAILSGTTYICNGSSTELKVALTGEAPWSLTFSDLSTPVVTSENPYVRIVNPTSTTLYTLNSVSDNSGCSNSGTGSAMITVNPLPTATISGTTSICYGNSTDITVSLTGTAPFFLTFNDGSIAYVNSYTYKKTVMPATSTNYYITKVVDAFGCSNTGTGIVTISLNQLPTALITGDAEICVGSSTEISVALTGQAPWTIVFSDWTSVNTSSNPYIRTVSPTRSTAYGIASVTDGNGCSNAGTGLAIIIVRPKPTATIFGTTEICRGGSAILTVELTGAPPWSLTFSDDPGNPVTGILSSPYNREVSPEITTNYSILNITDGNGCSNIGYSSAQIIVRQLPTAIISVTGQNQICIGESTDLLVQITGIAPFTLTFNDGYQVVTYQTSFIRSVSPNISTNYSLEVSDGYSCSNASTGDGLVTVNSGPGAIISGDASVCYGESVDITVDLVGNPPWSLTFSDGFYDDNILSTPYIRTIENLTEDVVYTVTNVSDECEISAIGTGSANIKVSDFVAANITTSNYSICYNSEGEISVDLTGKAPWSLTFSDGFIQNNINSSPFVRIVNLTETTNFTITNVSDACGSSSVGTGQVTIFVEEELTAQLSGSNSICNGQSTDLIVNLTGSAPWSVTYSDNFTENNILTSPHIRNVSPLENVIYTLQNVTDGCANSIIGEGEAIISVNPLPTAQISGNAEICSGENAEISVELTGIAPFTLEFSDGFIAENINDFTYNRIVSPTTTTLYTVTVTDICNTEIEAEGEAVVSIKPLPTATISGTTLICPGESAFLSVELTGTPPWNLTFSDNYFVDEILNSPYIREVTPNTTTDYTILNVADANCENTGSGVATVTINSYPTATIGGEQTICAGIRTSILITFTGVPPFSVSFTDGWSAARIYSYTYSRKVKPSYTTEYELLSVSDAGDCDGTVSGTAIVNVNPLPIIFNVTGNGNIIGLDGSQENILYTLFRNGELTEFSLLGTGLPIEFQSQLVEGLYTIFAQNPATTCSQMMNGSYILDLDEYSNSQSVEIKRGWNLISSYIEPRNRDIENVFEDIENQINIVKTGDGLIYVPMWNINSIRNWNPSLGYAVNSTSATQLILQGQNIIPEYYPIPLNVGWNLISYLCDNQTSPEFALSSIEGDYILVKSNRGGVFAPGWGLNTIGYMNPGEAYYIYTNNNLALTYPSNSAQRAVAGEHFTPLAKHTSPQFSNTGNNATLLINLDGNNDEIEIAVFNQNNEILGTGAIENGVAVVTIWGDDEMTNEIDGAVFNEPLFVRLFNTNTLEYQELSLTRIKEITDDTELDELKYRTNAIYSARVSAQRNTNRILSITNVPNPASSYTTFEFSIANNGDAEILIYSMKGDLVAKLGNKEYKAGTYKLNFETGEIATGVYNVILRNGTDRATTLMIIQK